MGVVYIATTSRALTQSNREQRGQFDALRPGNIELDLRSIAPVVVLFSTYVPQIMIVIRVTNHSPYDVTITHLKVTVWFSQPTTELTLDAPFTVEAHSTRDDVFLKKLLEGNIADLISQFFERDDWSKLIALDATMSGTSDGGAFQTSRHFELRGHDLDGVKR